MTAAATSAMNHQYFSMKPMRSRVPISCQMRRVIVADRSLGSDKCERVEPVDQWWSYVSCRAAMKVTGRSV
jgi:hypothetical protein